MSHYYAISAYATTSRQYDDPFILIEPGMNAFNVLVDDVEDLVDRLKADGIRIDKVIQLDGSQLQDLGDSSS